MKRLHILLGAMLLCVGLATWAALAQNTGTNQGNNPVSPLIISEICAKNDSILADNEGKFRDYIELHNTGSPIDLTGYTITDGKNTSQPLDGIVLEKDAYRVFYLGGADTGFALGASGGDCVQLLDPQGTIVAQATVATLLADQVMLYDPSGYILSYEATPGFSNDAAGLTAFRKGSPAKDAKLLINEVLIANTSSWPGPQGQFPDVVELYNGSDEVLALDSYFLSDDPAQRFAYRLPVGSLAPGEYLLILCDGENRVDETGMIHTNFALSHGETLVLTDAQGDWLSATLVLPQDDQSLLLSEDGILISGEVSLGYPNDAQGIAQFAETRFWDDSPLVVTEVLLSSAGVPWEGAFRDVVEIQNRSDAPVSTAGWYLSDEADPFGWALPEQTLAPGEYLIITCSPQTTGFGLSAGETLRLMAPDYRFASSVSCVAGDLGTSIQFLGERAYSFGQVTLGTEDHAAFQTAQIPADLQFSELMSANTKYLKGSYSTTSDWMELYNGSDQEIRLADYCITDSKGNLSKYPLPDKVLGPGEYCVILLKDDPTNLAKGYGVVLMNLSSDGETLYLSKNGQIVDYVFLPSLSSDISYGRSGKEPYSTLQTPTPGKANSTTATVAAVPTVNYAQGSYDDVEYLDIVLSGEGTIYYTTNCKAPTRYSKQYTEPIRLTKTTVIRAICIPENGIASEVLDLTYLINEYDNLSVVSLVTDPDNLWHENYGIYVTGDGAAEEYPHYGANYWMDWEKRATVSLFEAEGGGFYSNCGLRIFGGWSRAQDKKSLSILFRDSYGDGSLNYPLFGEDSLDEYESFILRTSGQDATTARMRDVVITSLIGEYTDVPVQDYRPVVVYLNGEYWGLHYIREKINEHFIAGHYNMEAEDVHLTVLGGWSDSTYVALRNYAMNHDMSDPEHYAYMCSQMDIDSYIDFFIAEIWVANTDLGNVKYFIGPDGKWTWILYDTDISMGSAKTDRLVVNLGNAGIGGADSTCRTFAVRMMKNPEFREKFITRLAWQMNNVWTEENVVGRIDEIQGMIIGDMEKECRRWKVSYDYWLGCVDHLRDYARDRNGYMLTQIQDFFDLTDAEMRQYGFQV